MPQPRGCEIRPGAAGRGVVRRAAARRGRGARRARVLRQDGGVPILVASPDHYPYEMAVFAYGSDYALRMDISRRTAHQVRIPRVDNDAAIIVTRHGKDAAVVISAEDFQLLQRLKAAIVRTRPEPFQTSAAAIEAWDDNDELTLEELDTISGRSAG